MPGAKADLILHPIRMQIIAAISTYRATAKELGEAMPEVPQTTLYRHINALVEGGILKIVEENPIRGTVERVYALAAPPTLAPEDLQGMTKQDYEQVFTMILTTLMSDARRYLASKPDSGEIDLLADGVEFSKIQLNLSDEEYKAMNRQIVDMMMAAANNEPSPKRRRRVFSYLFIPADG